MQYLFLLLCTLVMDQPTNQAIIIKQGQWTALESPRFFHSTDGAAADFPTRVKLKADAEFLHVSFVCEKDTYVEQNFYFEHNQPLYNQEVFEVFIAPGTADPAQYLELEINPNNAVWAGLISNPSRGDRSDISAAMVEPASSKILHSAEKGKKSWSGTLSIPWTLVSAEKATQYRINFYRIVSTQSQTQKDWKCNVDNCAFLCWNSTLSGKKPAFHRPRRFGLLTILEK